MEFFNYAQLVIGPAGSGKVYLYILHLFSQHTAKYFKSTEMR
jgi:hypothetical protein